MMYATRGDLRIRMRSISIEIGLERILKKKPKSQGCMLPLILSILGRTLVQFREPYNYKQILVWAAEIVAEGDRGL